MMIRTTSARALIRRIRHSLELTSTGSAVEREVSLTIASVWHHQDLARSHNVIREAAAYPNHHSVVTIERTTSASSHQRTPAIRLTILPSTHDFDR